MNFRKIRTAGRIAGFAASTAGTLSGFLARRRFVPENEQPALRDRWTRRWAESLLALFNVSVLLDFPPDAGPNNLPKGALVIANHRSSLDIVLMLHTFGGQIVSRADLAGWPLIGAAATSVGTIFVDRSNSVSGAVTVREIAKCLKRGERVLLFPEGGTFAGDELRRFHEAAFVAASTAKAPVIPVGIAYQTGSEASFVNETFAQHMLRASGSKATRVALAVGAPIAPIRPAKLFTKAAFESVERLIAVARRRADTT